MTEERLGVLLIEDSEIFRQLIRHQLEEAAAGTIVLESVERLAAGLERLSAGGIDAVLLDLNLPDSTGIETLWKTLAHSPGAAVIVLTSLDDEDLALSAVKGGAQDYLGKEHISGEILVRSIRHAVERKRLHRKLESHAAGLERASQDLKQFARVAAEGMRSPLRVVAETCDFLLTDPGAKLDEESRARIRGALDDVERTRRLLRDLVAYTRAGARPPDSGAESSCEAVLAGVLDRLKSEIGESGLTVIHDALPDVAVEEDGLRQLLENLLRNAVDYRSDAPPEVHVHAERQADMWLFSVRDNGTGIDQEYPGQIFEPFEKLEPGATAGSGVGLAVCKRIVETTGGRIWVNSEAGRGSTFYFTLPAAGCRGAPGGRE